VRDEVLRKMLGNGGFIGKNIGKSWENVGKWMGKSWFSKIEFRTWWGFHGIVGRWMKLGCNSDWWLNEAFFASSWSLPIFTLLGVAERLEEKIWPRRANKFWSFQDPSQDLPSYSPKSYSLVWESPTHQS
jgi:hypothetical protein